MPFKIINIPSFIAPYFIELWVDHFKAFIKKNLSIFHLDVDTNLTLEFSDDEPVSNYAGPAGDIEDLKKELLNLLKGTNSIDLIDQIKRSQVIPQLSELESWIAEMIGVLNRASDYESNREKVREIIDGYKGASASSIAYVAGRYIDNEKKIILYNRVIQKNAKGLFSLPYYEAVFAHELFHAYHYQLARFRHQDEITLRKDYTATVVKESLASYFESSYCDEYHLPNTVRSDWYLDILSSPYSGAASIRDWSHFIEILTASFPDMDDALRKLFGYELPLFYKVKNSVEVVTKKVKTKGKTTTLVNPNPFVGKKAYATRYGVPIYLIPENERTFFKKLQKKKAFNIIVFDKDNNVIDSHLALSSKIKSVTRLRSNISSYAIIKGLKGYAKDVSYVLVVC